MFKHLPKAFGQLVRGADLCLREWLQTSKLVLGDGTRGLEMIFDHFLDLGHEELAFMTQV